MMKLFTVGPVMMYPEVLEESGRQLPYFRTDEFSELMLDSEMMLKKLLGTSEDSKVAFLTASGTGAMEAAVSNIFSQNDRLLIIVGGSFGKRFCEIADVHGISYDVLELGFGESFEPSMLERYDDLGYTGLLVNMDETSTGQLYDIQSISSFTKRNGMVLVVDAISSFLADELRMDDMGVDVVILSSQKALALSPGISMVVMNDSVYSGRLLKIHSPIYYLDLERHVSNQARGQTPFTPAVDTLLELNIMLHMISNQGIDNKVCATAKLARYFRGAVADLGIRIPDYPLSNAVTPLLFDGTAQDVYKRLKDEYELVLTPSGGDLKNTMLRVGHIGNLSIKDYDLLIVALKETLL